MEGVPPCRATTKAGTPCSNPGVVAGLCYAHDPGTRARNAGKAARDAEARKRALARHISPEQISDLGEIETSSDVKRAAALLFRWTVTGDVDAKTCAAAVQALRLVGDVRVNEEIEEQLRAVEEQLQGHAPADAPPPPIPLRSVVPKG